MGHSKIIYPGCFALTSEQRRFRVMLLAYPSLVPFWDFVTCECDVDLLTWSLDGLPFEEQQMARFFVTIWQPGNVLEFDVMQAMWVLSDEHWQVIERWVTTLEHPMVALRMMSDV